jgi:hypothetical protein
MQLWPPREKRNKLLSGGRWGRGAFLPSCYMLKILQTDKRSDCKQQVGRQDGNKQARRQGGRWTRRPVGSQADVQEIGGQAGGQETGEQAGRWTGRPVDRQAD